MHASKRQNESKQNVWILLNEYTFFDEIRVTEIDYIESQGKSTVWFKL